MGSRPAIAALGCGALAARPALLASNAHPTTTLVVLFVALLAVGLAVPLPRDHGCDRRVFIATLLIGVLAFGTGRLLIGGHVPVSVALPVVLANTLAAVAEEVWFRRLCYGLLAPAGPIVAIAGSTLLVRGGARSDVRVLGPAGRHRGRLRCSAGNVR